MIHIWNICDTSRLRVTNVTINNTDPEAACVNSSWHGPTGRWQNGAACDYYGKYGLYAYHQFSSNDFYNYGIFRLMVGGRGVLKSLFDVNYGYTTPWDPGVPNLTQKYAGGSPVDQLNAQGYQAYTDLAENLFNSDITHANAIPENGVYIWQDKTFSSQAYDTTWELQFGKGLAPHAPSSILPGKINGEWTHASMVDGYGMIWDYGQLHPSFSVPPLHMKWESYLDNYLDETACNMFANSKHGANKKVGLCSIYKSYVPAHSGGEGRDGDTSEILSYGSGVRSLNIFDLTQLV